MAKMFLETESLALKCIPAWRQAGFQLTNETNETEVL